MEPGFEYFLNEFNSSSFPTLVPAMKFANFMCARAPRDQTSLYGWFLATVICLAGVGCGSKETKDSAAATAVSTNGIVATTPGQDAYQAAQRLVGLSLRPNSTTTITFGRPKRDFGAGYQMQAEGVWQTWGWVDLPNAQGKPDREYWRAVMHYTGEGRKWRASWLKIGTQESGDAATWIGDPPPEESSD